VNIRDETPVHVRHCCAHICKYGDDEMCPVLSGRLKQEIECDCEGPEVVEMREQITRLRVQLEQVTAERDRQARLCARLKEFLNRNAPITAREKFIEELRDELDSAAAFRTTVHAALASLRAEIEAHDLRNPNMAEHSTALAWCVEMVDTTISSLFKEVEEANGQ